MSSAPILPMQKLSDICPSWKCTGITFQTKLMWPQFNPSLYFFEDELRMIVRTADYRLLPGGICELIYDKYRTDYNDIRTKNYLVRLSPQFNLIEDPVQISLPAEIGDPSWHEHLEDLRLFKFDGNMYASASLYDQKKDEISMKLLKLDADGKISGAHSFPSPFNRKKEKNWMPIPGKQKINFIHTCSPTVVVTFDPENNTMSTWFPGQGLDDLHGWSGSTQGCSIGDWTLCVVHKRDSVDGELSYSHRFVMFDAGLRICALSEPFVFRNHGIEFCVGLACRDAMLLLSYGVNDAEARIGAMSLYDALNSLTWRKPA